MFHSTKMDQYWSFWCQGWSNYQNQEVLWWNRAEEVGEASEVAEADEVNEDWGCISYKAWKITTVDFRVIHALEFSFILMFWNKFILSRIMKTPEVYDCKAACSVSSSTALSLCASQTKFSAKCGGDKMFNQAKKNNSSDNFVLSSFPSKYANRFWSGFHTSMTPVVDFNIVLY